MLLLVNVEKHQEVKYGVPISLVAGADEVCARCSFVQGKPPDNKIPSECISSLASTFSQVSQQEQNSASEVKPEPSDDRLAIVENESESPSSLATPTPTPMNELDQAIKRALSVTSASLPVVVTLPLGFCPSNFTSAISSLDTSKNGSGCDEEDLRLHNKTPSAIGLGPSTLLSVPDLRTMTNIACVDVKALQDQQICSESKPQVNTQILEEFYLRDPFACASPDKRQALCHMLNIDPYRLKVWFQNRRRRDKLNYENQKMKET
ncbi:homeobox domain protein [Ancylostoma ceylanicum]|uniref:Homeobox domain protein n=1 Tax=Ancylostoma ceylanicum TaxID=53326 RepID=A0A0D6LCL3_9BILA|nr:homeobox domain protein [Ancylostoma ceylanicum]